MKTSSRIIPQTIQLPDIPQLVLRSTDSLQSSSSKPQTKPSRRTQQHIGIHLIVYLSYIINIIVVFTPLYTSLALMLIIGIFASIPQCVLFLISILTLKNLKWGQMFKLIFMLDGIMLAELSAIISFTAFQIFLHPESYEYLGIPCVILLSFLIGGSFRTMTLYSHLKTYNVIIIKLLILINALAYIIIGCYIFSIAQDDPYLSGSLLDFFLLYIFSEFAFYMEIYNEFCQFDGTNEYKSQYLVLGIDDQDRYPDQLVQNSPGQQNPNQSMIERKNTVHDLSALQLTNSSKRIIPSNSSSTIPIDTNLENIKRVPSRGKPK